ncbi:MAG: hypothetical protein ACRCSP_09650 [Rhodoglobus sp.]
MKPSEHASPGSSGPDDRATLLHAALGNDAEFLSDYVDQLRALIQSALPADNDGERGLTMAAEEAMSSWETDEVNTLISDAAAQLRHTDMTLATLRGFNRIRHHEST